MVDLRVPLLVAGMVLPEGTQPPLSQRGQEKAPLERALLHYSTALGYEYESLLNHGQTRGAQSP